MKLAQTLSSENSKQVLFLYNDDSKSIQVHQNDDFIWLTYNDVIQTAIEISAPYRSVLPHNYVMLLPLLFDNEPKTILELGAGALSTQRYLKHTRPNIKMTSVESEPIMLEICKQHFPDFSDLNVTLKDAYQYVEELSKTKNKFDWLMVDLFHGEQSPVHNSPKGLFNTLFELIESDGWLIINVLTKEKAKLQQLSLLLSEFSGSKLYVYPVPEMQNHIFLLTKNVNFQFPDEIEQQNLTVF